MSYLSRCFTRTIVLNVRRHVNVNIAQAYYKVSVTIMGTMQLRLKELQWGAWGNPPWLFYMNAAVTVNAYNVTLFCRYQIYVNRMQQYINGHFYCTKPDHLWLQRISLRHGQCDTPFNLGVVVSSQTTYFSLELYKIQYTNHVLYSTFCRNTFVMCFIWTLHWAVMSFLWGWNSWFLHWRHECLVWSRN
jgi:hypothetical protein